MSAIRVKTRIPENRQITLTLPPEFPVGEAELEIAVREPAVEFNVVLPEFDRPKAFPPRPTDPALAAEYDAFERMLPELMRHHAGKYVALRGGVVVAEADTKIDAATAAHQQQPGVPAYTRLVTDQPQPIPRVGSPREVRRGE
jgi:hypothetical protein